MLNAIKNRLAEIERLSQLLKEIEHLCWLQEKLRRLSIVGSQIGRRPLETFPAAFFLVRPAGRSN